MQTNDDMNIYFSNHLYHFKNNLDYIYIPHLINIGPHHNLDIYFQYIHNSNKVIDILKIKLIILHLQSIFSSS